MIPTHRREPNVPCRAAHKNAGRDSSNGFCVESAILAQINVPGGGGFVLPPYSTGALSPLLISASDRFGPDSISARRTAVGDVCMEVEYRVRDDVCTVDASIKPCRSLLVVHSVASSGDGQSIIFRVTSKYSL